MKHIQTVLHDSYHHMDWNGFNGHKFMFNLYCKTFEVEISEFEKEIVLLKKIPDTDLVSFIVKHAVGLECKPTMEQAISWRAELIKWANSGSN